MTTEKNYSFSGVVESVAFGKIKTAIFVPHHITLALPAGRVKARGIINGVPFSVSILFRRNRGRFFPLNSRLSTAARLDLGSAAAITFSLIPKERVELPDGRETILTEQDKNRKVLRVKPAAEQTIIARYVEAVKNIDSRVRRAFEQVGKGRMKFRNPNKVRRKRDN